MRKIAVVICGLLFVASARALTLSEIRTEVRRNVRDAASDTTLRKYSDTILNSFINEAQRETNNLTWAVEKSTSYVLSAGTTYYSLPSNFIASKLVTFADRAGLIIKLDEQTQAKSYQEEADFERSDSGTPDHFFIRYPETAGGALQVAYLPVPATTSTGTVKMWYTYQPPDLSADADVALDEFPHLVPYHYVLVAHATARIKELEGRFDEAKYYTEVFLRYIGTMAQRFRATPGYFPSVQAAPR